MDVPTSLNGWSLDVIKEIAATGHEGERFDFKLSWPQNDQLSDLACAFANTYGGFIILGVGQHKGKFEIRGMIPDPEITRNFHDKIKVEPEIRTAPPLTIEFEGKHIYIFEIRQSQTKPHQTSAHDKRDFLKRMPAKNVRMTLTEVRHFMSDFESKREKLTLFLIDMHFKLKDLEIYWQQNNLRTDFTQQDVSIIDTTIAATYGLVRDNPEFMFFAQEYRALIVYMNTLKTKMPDMVANKLSILASGWNETSELNALFSRVERFRFLYMKLSEYLYDNFDVENPYNPITAFGQHRPKRQSGDA